MDDPTAQCRSYLDLPDTPVDFSTDQSLVTSVGCSHNVNFQALLTFGDSVFVYIFGDKLSQITVSGISFCTCEGNDHGTTKMMEWWLKYKASKRRDVSNVMIGTKVLRSVLVNFQHGTMDLELGLASWNATYQGLHSP